MAQLIKTDGSITIVNPKNGKTFSGDEIHNFVAGYFEALVTKDGRWMFVDEEGKLKGKAINATATDLYKYGQYDCIVGDVLVCAAEEVD